jgi:toxin ParE1/3/4
LFDKRKISLSDDARLDLREAYDWYEAARPELGKRFVRHLADTLDAISERSSSFPIVYRTARRAIIRRFPYGLFFRDRGTHLEIFAIVDLRRHPRVWRRRA